MTNLLSYVSDLMKASTSVALRDGETRVVSVGATIPIGEFFWIKTCIGMAENAEHGHRIRDETSPGSADVDCSVRVLKVIGDNAVVVLLRPQIPYGAPAPHGTIFVVPVRTLEEWPVMTAHRRTQESARDKLRRELGRVRA